jgi:hypothetical protein
MEILLFFILLALVAIAAILLNISMNADEYLPSIAASLEKIAIQLQPVPQPIVPPAEQTPWAMEPGPVVAEQTSTRRGKLEKESE